MKKKPSVDIIQFSSLLKGCIAIFDATFGKGKYKFTLEEIDKKKGKHAQRSR
jgi:major membrane immunogen (membrane-anchored lipoprotein)